MRYLVAASFLLAIVGCGGSSDAGPSDNAETTSATASEETASVDTASVEQYASIIAKTKPEYLAKMEDCDWLGTGDLDGGTGAMECQIGLLTLSTEAGIITASLGGASKEGVPAYIGAVPDEIADLVDETTTASKALGAAATKANRAGCAQTGAGQCGGLRGDVLIAMSALDDALAGWTPYL